MSYHYVIEFYDAFGLEAMGLASPVSSDNTRRVHKRLLTPASEKEYAHLPLTPISLAGPQSDLYETLPHNLHSMETLRHIGFTDAAADEIWDEWRFWQAQGGDDFLAAAMGHLVYARDLDTRGEDDDDDDAEWTACMDAAGLRPEVQAAIMDPIYRRDRTREKCSFWMDRAVEQRFEGLVAIQSASIERVKLAGARLKAAEQRSKGLEAFECASREPVELTGENLKPGQSRPAAGISILEPCYYATIKAEGMYYGQQK
jgi:hypothetical protein